MAIKSLFRLVMFFLGMPCRLISFFTTHEALLVGLSVRVYFYIRVAAGVINEAYLIWVLLVVVAVCKVGV